MKKLLWILLFPVAVSAQIPGRLDSLQARVFSAFKLPSTGAGYTTTARVWQAINDAQTSVCKEFDAFEKLDTVLVKKTTEGGALNSDFLRVFYVDRIIGNDLRIPMQEIDPRNRWATTGGTLQGSQYAPGVKEQPRYYWVLGKRLMTHPKDNRDNLTPDSLLVGYWASAHVLDTANDSTDIDGEFRDALIWKACAAIARLRGGADSPVAVGYENLYSAEVAKYGRKAK